MGHAYVLYFEFTVVIETKLKEGGPTTSINY